jgi:hypothetical protein
VGQAVELREDGLRLLELGAALRAVTNVGAQRAQAEARVAVEQHVEFVGEEVSVHRGGRWVVCGGLRAG